MKYKLIRFVVLIMLPFFFTGCGTTSAPTESSTKTTDKTVNSTTDATSSSTPGKESSNSARAENFTRENFARVKADMSAGGGEHLAALAVLLEIPVDQEERFFALSREQYAFLYESPVTSAGLMLTRLKYAMTADLQSER